MLLPEYARQLLENYQGILSQLASQLRWLHFDEAFRLVTRVGWLDDGWVRVRVDGGSALDINMVEVLRELSWLYYSVAEMGRNLDMLKNALESVGLDRLRVAAEVALSELNLTRVSGATLTARDWSQDFARLQNLDIALSALRDAVVSKLDELGALVLLGYTTTPLAAGASWTSPVDSDPATGRIVGSVYADQPGTLCVEQSPDGANWDVVDCFSVSAGSGLGFSVEKVCPHARVRYVNGTAAQTVFRLYAYKRLRVV
jgi:hypothetical protein